MAKSSVVEPLTAIINQSLATGVVPPDWKTAVIVVSWGFDETGQPAEELTLVEMPVVSQETCIRSYSELFERFISDYTYCAGNRNGTSVCKRDSGSGMVFRQNGLWYLRGLVSLSVARPNEYPCDPTHYVVFTDLAKLLPWIYSKVSDY
ncbi:hypothetical protein PYW08_008171 [Mythimna loreyi]|uniref:Uncharacterized protein n=1 Tax=Mythimna loreyi TaxID=667449 RepID=A0ACC2QCL8_9NEOP|nr:hypothetical protein PYW08_008171 [Mythimna loreyi]